MSTPWNDVWVAVQDLGFAINRLSDKGKAPYGLRGLDHALDRARSFIEDKALAEEVPKATTQPHDALSRMGGEGDA